MRALRLTASVLLSLTAGDLLAGAESLPQPVVGRLLEIRSPAYWLPAARGEPNELDPNKDTGRELHVGEWLRCGPRGFLRLQLFGTTAEIKGPSDWHRIVVRLDAPDLPNRKGGGRQASVPPGGPGRGLRSVGILLYVTAGMLSSGGMSVSDRWSRRYVLTPLEHKRLRAMGLTDREVTIVANTAHLTGKSPDDIAQMIFRGATVAMIAEQLHVDAKLVAEGHPEWSTPEWQEAVERGSAWPPGMSTDRGDMERPEGGR